MLLFKILLRYVISPIIFVSILGIIATTLIYLYYSSQTPSVSELKNTQLNLPLRVYSSDDQLIAEFGEHRRRPVKYDQIPDNLKKAFISIEDSRFYQHKGVDFKGIARALLSAVKNGKVSQGASTITMQVARNFYLTNEKTLDRKLREALLALKIEDELSKKEILELYLNKIFLGKRSYGVGSAAEIYYGKKVEELTLAQSAMIAGLPKAPSRYNPITNPKRAKLRRDYILKRMLELGYISETDYQTALTEELTAKIHNVENETYAPYMAEMARADAIRRYGEENIYKLGLKIYTTLDSEEQDNAIKTLRKNLLSYTKRHGYRGAEDKIDLSTLKTTKDKQDKLKKYKVFADLYPALVLSSDAKKAILAVYKESKPVTITLKQMSWARKYINENKRGKKPKSVKAVLAPGDVIRVKKDNKGLWNLSQVPKVTGALVAMNPKNGAIEAIAGGFDFTYSKFNRAIQAKRQPGSSFKPFVYAAALAKGYSPATTVEDEPLELKNSTWNPQNYGHDFGGPTRLRVALAKSKNLVSIRLLQQIGLQYTIDYAKRFGFKKRTLPEDLTLALGTGSATPLEMATAYSSFANGGFKVESYFIRKIVDRTNTTIFEANPYTACEDCSSGNSKQSNINPAKRIMKPTVHYQITSMLQSVAQSGTGSRSNRLGRRDLAGKTGTTDDQKDAWFCGFSPTKVTTVWVGFDRIAPLGRKETAAGAALPIWIDFMKTALKGKKDIGWKVPRGLINVQLDAETGMPPNEYTIETINEALTPDQIPTEEEILAYMAAHREDMLEQQEIRNLENMQNMDEVTRARHMERIRREAAQRQENQRRRELARQREIDRLRSLGIEPPESLMQQQLPSNNNQQYMDQTQRINSERIEMPEQLF
ncbi:MAG: penicillin-binding protein 1A [Thiotrichales bacterium]|nr:MAG: penicillin-binding protein 1A [Thiotrichales bacterium]